MNVVVPSDGVYGSYYAQGVVKDSPHQTAGKLWVEHILSDEGALGYLEGGAVPARYAALLAAGKVSDDLKKNLPGRGSDQGHQVPDRRPRSTRPRRPSPRTGGRWSPTPESATPSS